MIELTLNFSKSDNFVFIDKETGFAVTRLNSRGVVSCITPSLQRAIDSGTLIITKDFRVKQEVKPEIVEPVEVIEEQIIEEKQVEEAKPKRKPRTKK